MSFVAMALLVPYFGWGIYALRLKYRFHEELSLGIEACTLLGLAVFYAVEIALLRETLAGNLPFYAFALLGLFASGAALYGHMAISFLSRIVVEILVPGHDAAPDRPRLGPAEALESQHDYDGALQEYLVVARIFPKDALVAMRVGGALMALERPQEAAGWYSRALQCADTEERAVGAVNRLIEVHGRRLGAAQEARTAVAELVKRWPGCKEAKALEEAVEQLATGGDRHVDAGLVALEAAPLEVEPAAPKRARGGRKAAAAVVESTLDADTGTGLASAGLERLEDAPQVPEPLEAAREDAEEPRADAAALPGLAALDERPIEAEPEPEAPRAKEGDAPGSGLELL